MPELQRTPEWHRKRLGKVTASRVSDVVTRTKSGYGASRANYLAELLVERITGAPTDGYQNAAMLYGIEKEPEARAAYAFHYDCDVQLVDFCPHPSIEMAGASPDGLIGEHGLVEIKCPTSATHLEALLGDPIPLKYIHQMQWQMACTGRQWCDFASYDPRFPAEHQLHVTRVMSDAKTIDLLEREVQLFLKELDTKLQTLRGELRVA
jgi:putative phage-type endonuclease